MTAPKDTQTTPVRNVYGLNGICELFHVSKVTAIKYKKTFLAPAIKQRGKVIITDVDKALQLFSER